MWQCHQCHNITTIFTSLWTSLIIFFQAIPRSKIPGPKGIDIFIASHTHCKAPRGPVQEGQWNQDSSGRSRRRLGAEQPWWWQAFPTRWPVPKRAPSSLGRWSRDAQQSCPVYPPRKGGMGIMAWASELRHSICWAGPWEIRPESVVTHTSPRPTLLIRASVILSSGPERPEDPNLLSIALSTSLVSPLPVCTPGICLRKA